MNFEKWMKKRGNQKIDKYAKNPYHVSWFKRVPRWVKIFTPIATCATALMIVVLIAIPTIGRGGAMSNDNYKNSKGNPGLEGSNNATLEVPTDNGSRSQNELTSFDGSGHQTGEETQIEKALLSANMSLVYNNNNYTIDGVDGAPMISASYVDIKKSDIAAVTANASIYKIRNITEEAALAVNFDGTSNFYVYINKQCDFSTIEYLKGKLSLQTELKYCYITKISNTDASEDSRVSVANEGADLTNLLFKDGSATEKSTDAEKTYQECYMIEATIPSLGGYNVNIVVYDDGDIRINIFDKIHTYSQNENVFTNLSNYLQAGTH